MSDGWVEGAGSRQGGGRRIASAFSPTAQLATAATVRFACVFFLFFPSLVVALVFNLVSADDIVLRLKVR